MSLSNLTFVQIVSGAREDDDRDFRDGQVKEVCDESYRPLSMIFTFVNIVRTDFLY